MSKIFNTINGCYWCHVRMALYSDHEVVKFTQKEHGYEREVKLHPECVRPFNKFLQSPYFLRQWSKNALNEKRT